MWVQIDSPAETLMRPECFAVLRCIGTNFLDMNAVLQSFSPTKPPLKSLVLTLNTNRKLTSEIHFLKNCL